MKMTRTVVSDRRREPVWSLVSWAVSLEKPPSRRIECQAAEGLALVERVPVRRLKVLEVSDVTLPAVMAFLR